MKISNYLSARAACAVLLLGITVATVLSVSWSDVGSGAFFQAEYRIRLKTGDGKVMQNVIMTVTDKDGRLSYSYPVDDFTTNRLVVSNAEGVVVFHHIGDGVEFTVVTTRSLFSMPKRDPKFSTPVYFCNFFSNGKLIRQIRYDQLDSELARRLLAGDRIAHNTLSRNQVFDFDPSECTERCDERIDFFVVEKQILLDD